MCKYSTFLLLKCLQIKLKNPYVPWSKVAILGMVIPPVIENPYNGYVNPYYWVDDHPLLYGNNGSLDPIAHMDSITQLKMAQNPGDAIICFL